MKLHANYNTLSLQLYIGPAHSSTSNSTSPYTKTSSSNNNSSHSKTTGSSRPLTTTTDYVYVDTDEELALNRGEGANNLINGTVTPLHPCTGLNSGNNADVSADSEAESVTSVDPSTALLIALEKGPNSGGNIHTSSTTTNHESNSSTVGGSGGGSGGMGWLKSVWGNSALGAKERDK